MRTKILIKINLIYETKSLRKYLIMHNLFTLRKENGSSISTLRDVMLLVDDTMSVSSFKKFLSIFTPSFVSRSHLSVKSVSSVFPVMVVVTILILSELRSLHIVEVDSLFRPLNNIFPNILLISVDFPALVSPKINMQPLPKPQFITEQIQLQSAYTYLRWLFRGLSFPDHFSISLVHRDNLDLIFPAHYEVPGHNYYFLGTFLNSYMLIWPAVLFFLSLLMWFLWKTIVFMLV